MGWVLLVLGFLLTGGPTVRVGETQATASPIVGAVMGLVGLTLVLVAKRKPYRRTNLSAGSQRLALGRGRASRRAPIIH